MENELEKKEYVAELLLLYGKLLTENVRRRMEMFYLEDYSITEISQLEKVSRNAVFESLHSGAKLLEKNEEKLMFLKKNQTIAVYLDRLEKEENQEKRKELIQQIKGELGYGI